MMTSETSTPTVIIIMGVAGSGKTTVGEVLSTQLGWKFADADSFHPEINVRKMGQGLPLTDIDRGPWLLSLRDAIAQWIAQEQPTILACSALKNAYRCELQIDPEKVRLVYLKASIELVSERLQHRQGHFMKAKMLQSQFLTLEEPTDVPLIDAAKPPAEIVNEIRLALKV